MNKTNVLSHNYVCASSCCKNFVSHHSSQRALNSLRRKWLMQNPLSCCEGLLRLVLLRLLLLLTFEHVLKLQDAFSAFG